MTLVLIGLVGGIITGLSPCVLPVLPVIFLGGGTTGAGTAGAGARRAGLTRAGAQAGDAAEAGAAAQTVTAQARRRPYVIVGGLTLSFAVFTLFGSIILASLHLPDDAIRWIGLVLLVLVGLGLLVPPLGHLLERPFYRFPQRFTGTGRNGFVLGIALGAVFVPCAGPVLAAITVAGATNHVGWRTVGLTLGFAVGTAIPLLAFALAGRGLSERVAAFRRRQGVFRAVSGVVVIALAVALTFNISDIIQRDVPNYTQAVGNSLEKGASGSGNSGSGGSGANAGPALSLQDCQAAALYGGSGLEQCGAAPAFAGIQQWLNTPGGKPLTMASLKGKVVLVDFWAYSCINCQRELPHAEAWAKNYAADGLEVIGVHTPEYTFEHVPSNVAAGAQRLGLTFPVALDNSYGTWNAYDNQSWPAAYLIDATGKIRHVSIGEGGYPQEEQLLRQLLTTAHPGVKLPAATDVPDTTPVDQSQTPETYLGSERTMGYQGSTAYANGTHQFSLPAGSLETNTFGLSGSWTVAAQSISAGKGAEIALAYHAANVYLDVGGAGTLTVTGGGTTKVIKVSGAPDIYTVAALKSAGDGAVTIKLSPGLTAYSFTFG